MAGDGTFPDPRSSRRPRRGPTDRGSAYDAALGFLAQRPRTVAEVRRHLEARGDAVQEVQSALERLTRASLLDDAALAFDYVVTRARRMGHAPGRLIEDLCRRGVAREVSRAAVARAINENEIDPEELLREQAQRRLVRERRPFDRRVFARVYNALLRAGFDGDAVRGELERHRAEPGDDQLFAGGIDDDFP